jgi:hypothetical protein
LAESTPSYLPWVRRAARASLLGSLLLFPAAGALAEGLPAAPLPLADAPRPAHVEVIFTGFARRTDKGASIFVRMTGEVPVVVEQSGRRIVYRLTGARMGVKNNANPLPTGSFGPPVSNVALIAGNGSVDVVIDLTSDPGETAPAYHVVSQSGISTLVVELPPPVSS